MVDYLLFSRHSSLDTEEDIFTEFLVLRTPVFLDDMKTGNPEHIVIFFNAVVLFPADI